ncbi:uncharacterized protein LOC135825157 [Sycon ciliatum]|uniref:uncharacterized protein LOC135824599 n=1 Tax=Sycon ciliatum TaxID=27933 RepID=UPI0031F5FB76
MAKNRTFDVRTLVQYELGPVPWAIATVDGGMVSTQKSKLLHALGKDSALRDHPPAGCCVVIDAMALLQATPSPPPTFGALSDQIFRQLLANMVRSNASRVDFVTDRYWDISIKQLERQKRTGQQDPLVIRAERRDQATPKEWKRYLSNGTNKTNLVQFLATDWKTSEHFVSLLGTEKQVIITVGTTCIQLAAPSLTATCLRATEIPELSCTHEEADTRLLLHSAHATSHGFQSALICSPDTDVAVIAIGLSTSINGQLVFKTGSAKKPELVDISALSAKLGPAASEALIGLHAFTGCDSVSAFSGKGKKAALELIKKDCAQAEAMAELGKSFNVDERLQGLCEVFLARLYGCASLSNINDVRFELLRNNSSTPQNMPPSRDALRKHVLRANYQAVVWRLALQPSPEIPSPDGNGWRVSDQGGLSIVWMEQQAAPQDILKLVSCKCQTGCSTRRCSCRSQTLSCTDICQCKGCKNSFGTPSVPGQATLPQELAVPEESEAAPAPPPAALAAEAEDFINLPIDAPEESEAASAPPPATLAAEAEDLTNLPTDEPSSSSDDSDPSEYATEDQEDSDPQSDFD